MNEKGKPVIYDNDGGPTGWLMWVVILISIIVGLTLIFGGFYWITHSFWGFLKFCGVVIGIAAGLFLGICIAAWVCFQISEFKPDNWRDYTDDRR